MSKTTPRQQANNNSFGYLQEIVGDGAWLTGRCKRDERIRSYLKWRSRYVPMYLELKIAIVQDKPNIAGALDVLAELAEKYGLALSWNLRKRVD